MKILKKFILTGVITGFSIFTINTLIAQPSIYDYQTTIDNLIINENLSVSAKIIKDSIYSSSARLSNNNYNNTTLNLGFVVTNLSKIMAPFSSFKADTKGFYEFISLHEYSHAELHFLIKSKSDFFNAKFSNLDETLNNNINLKLENFFTSSKHNGNILFSNFHENFADTYGSILLIRNFTNKYSDEEIKSIISARYEQVKNQGNFLFGAFGDLEHRTEKSLKEVLNLDFQKIREMNPNEAKKLSLVIASNGAIEQYKSTYKSLLSSTNISSDLNSNDKKKIQSFQLADINTTVNNIKDIRFKSAINNDIKNKL